MIQVLLYETCEAGLSDMQEAFPANMTTVITGYASSNDILSNGISRYSNEYSDGLIIAKSEVTSTVGHGPNNVFEIIRKIIPDTSKTAMIYLSRYNDRCDQSKLVSRFTMGSNLTGYADKFDLFESFNPYGSDVIYFTPSAVRQISDNLPIPHGITAERFLSTRIINGYITCYTTSPDVFTYNLGKCMSYSDNFSKTITCSIPPHSSNVVYPSLLSQNITLFWIFVVLFVTCLSLVFYRFMKHR